MTSGDPAAPPRTPLAYRAAGVDIDAGEALVAAIAPLARATARPGTLGGIGGFGALFDPRAAGFRDPVLVATTDGVGTKLKIAIEAGLHDLVGIDLVAMCVNDLIVQGAEPLFFLDYFATGRLEVAHAKAVIAGIAAGCKEAGCALVGGETAEMPGMYAGGDYDLAGFAVGAAERGRLLPRGVAAGDAVLGLAASGVHSNGFSLVRRIVAASGLGWADPAPFGIWGGLGDASVGGASAVGESATSESVDRERRAGENPAAASLSDTSLSDTSLGNASLGGTSLGGTSPVGAGPGGSKPADDNPGRASLAGATLGQALMTPTRIYVRLVLALHHAGLLKAAAHITGGGLAGNLPRVLPAGTRAALSADWPVPPVFRWLARTGNVAPDEMLRVFNCGIGMALVVAAADAPRATALLAAEGETVVRLGVIEPAAPGAAPSLRLDLPAGWPR